MQGQRAHQELGCHHSRVTNIKKMEDTEGERHGAVESVKMRVLIPKSPALCDISRQTDPKEELPESWVSGGTPARRAWQLGVVTTVGPSSSWVICGGDS